MSMIESAAIQTMVKIMESLPEPTRNQVVDLVREYVADLEDEAIWDAQFEQTEAKPEKDNPCPASKKEVIRRKTATSKQASSRRL